MIWLVWKRYRFLLALTFGLLVVLACWMFFMGRQFESAAVSTACREETYRCPLLNGTLALTNQAFIVNLLLLFIPCLIGLLFGASLVAGELQHHTNRLAWSQGTTRTTWLVTKWCCVIAVPVILIVLLTVESQWWTGHIFERFTLDLGNAGAGRLSPGAFPVSGVAPVAYTLFAFALGACLGAVFRRSSWAVVGTVVAYTAVSVVMVLFIRPSLAPKTFVAFPPPTPAGTTPAGASTGVSAITIPAHSWDLGLGYRYKPGTPSSEMVLSANAVNQRCEKINFDETPYETCLESHHVEMGYFYQPGTHYWDLQWRESGLLLLTSGALFGATVWSVRRWQA